MIRNAKIRDCGISYKNGVASARMYVIHADGIQGFGDQRTELELGHFVSMLMRVAAIDDFSELPGCSIRIDGDNGRIDAIGHITENIWLHMSEFQFQPEKEL